MKSHLSQHRLGVGMKRNSDVLEWPWNHRMCCAHHRSER